ncbi:GFER family protein [Megaselia abdita]
MSVYDFNGSNSKPDRNCRSCTDFKSWSKQSNQFFTQSKGTDDKPRKDCPLDKNELGRSSWGLLHTMAAHYPDNPTDQQKSDVKTFFSTFSRLYPCEWCSKDFTEDVRNNPVDPSSQEKLSKWLCDAHNRVNAKLGKPEFDCSKTNERWRDGWLDGSCE